MPHYNAEKSLHWNLEQFGVERLPGRIFGKKALWVGGKYIGDFSAKEAWDVVGKMAMETSAVKIR